MSIIHLGGSEWGWRKRAPNAKVTPGRADWRWRTLYDGFLAFSAKDYRRVRRSISLRAVKNSRLVDSNTLERLSKAAQWRANAVGIFPNQASIRRLIGAVLMEQNEALRRRRFGLAWALTP